MRWQGTILNRFECAQKQIFITTLFWVAVANISCSIQERTSNRSDFLFIPWIKCMSGTLKTSGILLKRRRGERSWYRQPSSNYLLGRVADLKNHPIARLYRSGVDVTINSDDVLIFDSDVSKEYMRLYRSGCLNPEELDDIRRNGLKDINSLGR